MTKKFQMYIGGQWLDSASGETFPSTNPYTGEVWAEFPAADEADVDRAVSAARDAFEDSWGRMLPGERARIMRQIAAAIGEHANYLAQVETRDNGKLIREISGQANYLVNYYHYFAGAADKIHREVIPTDKPAILRSKVSGLNCPIKSEIPLRWDKQAKPILLKIEKGAD